jgi:hypothetical protein
VTFLTPALGRSYQALLDELAAQLGWPIAFAKHAQQQTLIAVVQSIVTRPLAKLPGVHGGAEQVTVRLASGQQLAGGSCVAGRGVAADWVFAGGAVGCSEGNPTNVTIVRSHAYPRLTGPRPRLRLSHLARLSEVSREATVVAHLIAYAVGGWLRPWPVRPRIIAAGRRVVPFAGQRTLGSEGPEGESSAHVQPRQFR